MQLSVFTHSTLAQVTAVSKLKIAVYTMAKNESKHIDQFCNTAAAADVVVVTDTGSTDGTPELLRCRGVIVPEASIQPWRFDTASNVALANVPADIDVCVKLDLDEVLWSPPGTTWREAIEAAWTAKTTQLQYTYVWNWQVLGKVPGVQFTAVHIHARSGYFWKHPGHAALTYTGDSCVATPVKNLQIHHYAASSKSRPDYISLLRLGVAENECPRTLFYLGREYVSRRMWDHAIATLKTYLEHKKSNWTAERTEAMRMLGMCFAAQQQHPQAMQWLIRATAEYPAAREPWYSLLEYMLSTMDWSGAVWAGNRCLSITVRDLGYVTQSAAAWSDAVYIKLATAHQKLSHTAAVIRVVESGLQAYPTSEALQQYAVSTGLFEAST